MRLYLRIFSGKSLNIWRGDNAKGRRWYSLCNIIHGCKHLWNPGPHTWINKCCREGLFKQLLFPLQKRVSFLFLGSMGCYRHTQIMWSLESEDKDICFPIGILSMQATEITTVMVWSLYFHICDFKLWIEGEKGFKFIDS